MVRARLHLICGNCGCNDDWTWSYDPEAMDDGVKFTPDVTIKCGNCSTHHSLSVTAPTDVREEE